MDDRIGLEWLDGASNGGSSIIDYQVWFDNGDGSGSYTLLTSSLTLREYLAVGLYSGTTYSFKVKARNSVGFSELSDSIEILAA